MNWSRAAVAPLLSSAVAHETDVEKSRTWRRITLVAAACITVLDGALLQRKLGIFTGGFLAAHPFGTVPDSAAFLGLTALLNAAIAAPLTLAVIAIGCRLHLRPRAVQFAAFAAAVIPLGIADFLTYQVWWYLGDAFDFQLMQNLAGRRISEVIAVVTPLLSRPLFLFVIGMASVVGVTALLHRFTSGTTDRGMLPSARAALARCTALVALSSVCVVAVMATSESMSFALRWTPSGQLFSAVLNRLSDFDRDGYGLLRNPRDLAPFDSTIQPYAVDIPGNGIDENGLAGDLPAGTAIALDSALPRLDWPQRPPIVLFVLESVRADVVGAVHGGRRITPVMDALAAEGVKVESAWSHNGVTSQSRYHLLTGNLTGGRGRSSLLGDFKDHGYDVAYFSGQNDDFGTNSVDYSRVDKYYDARQDVAARYSRSTTPGSLAVPLAVVESRIREYLKARRSAAPLFLYVNFHDTHYPYNHPGLENLIGEELLPPALISPARRPELHRTYLNATANVDRAIGRVIGNVESHLGQRPAVMVISDHGESLFEQGFLGHGYALNDAQTRIPFIVSGLPMTIDAPFGQADLRRTLNDALAKPAGVFTRPAVRPLQSARVFQYLGPLDSPMQIGWMTADGSFVYDFRSDDVHVWEGSVRRRNLIGEPRRMFQELVHTFETMLLANTRTHDAPSPTERPDGTR